jgi:hypothetical protein
MASVRLESDDHRRFNDDDNSGEPTTIKLDVVDNPCLISQIHHHEVVDLELGRLYHDADTTLSEAKIRAIELPESGSSLVSFAFITHYPYHEFEDSNVPVFRLPRPQPQALVLYNT